MWAAIVRAPFEKRELNKSILSLFNPRRAILAGMTVYCYDLVPIRTHRWTRQHDAVLRAEYFPGLDPAMLIEPLARAGKPLWGPNAAKAVANRLSYLGLRNRRRRND
jgi:hypothetical protein